MKKWIKRGVIATVAVGFMAVLAVVLCFYVVRWSAADRVYDNVEDVPYNVVALLLGTAPVTPYGTHNYYFDYRIEAAVKLYEAGKVSYFIVSGDNHKEGYDEPQWMRDSLVKYGVPAEIIHFDYAGFRTLDSVVRAKEVFGQNSITIVSQKFHNERAVFLAKGYGINAVGYNAQDVERWQKKLEIAIARESLARVKMFIDLLLGKKPKFLGNKIDVNNGYDTKYRNSVAGHKECAWIVGNFTGHSIDTLCVENVCERVYDTDSTFFFQIRGKVIDESDYRYDTYYFHDVVSSNSKLPNIQLDYNMDPSLVNEGDLDGNGTCEIGVLDTWDNSNCRAYYIYTYKNGKWCYLVPPISTAYNLRASGLEIAEPGPEKGQVSIRYSDFDAPHSCCNKAPTRDSIYSVSFIDIKEYLSE